MPFFFNTTASCRAFKKIRDQVDADSHGSPAENGNGNAGESNTAPAQTVSKGPSASASSQGVSGRGRASSASSDNVTSGAKLMGRYLNAAMVKLFSVQSGDFRTRARRCWYSTV